MEARAAEDEVVIGEVEARNLVREEVVKDLDEVALGLKVFFDATALKAITKYRYLHTIYYILIWSASPVIRAFSTLLTATRARIPLLANSRASSTMVGLSIFLIMVGI